MLLYPYFPMHQILDPRSSENIISRSHIEKKLVALVKDYYNKVYIRVHRKSAKKKGTAPKHVSMRVAIAEWRRESNKLFNIGRRMETVTGREKIFYLDQQTNHECRLSEEVDDISEMNEEIIRLEAAENKEREMVEELCAMGGPEEDSQMFDGAESSVVGQETVSLNRSGLTRHTLPTVEIGVQTDLSCPDRPKFRVVKKQATQEIKSNCATVSALCGLSTENSRKCVKIVAKNLYGHDFYLAPSAQLEGECGIIDYTPRNHVPVKAADYENYTDVLPSSRTISDFKQLQASEVERGADMALYHKQPGSKAIWHYDTTSRSSIDGDWPSLIIRITNCDKPVVELRLRPIYFAFENREQIIDLPLCRVPNSLICNSKYCRRKGYHPKLHLGNN